MILEFDVPELAEYPNGFPGHYANVIFGGNVSSHWQTNALMMSYVRLVEAAHIHYRAAREQADVYWNKTTGVGSRAATLSATYFEDCINAMHRAVLCMRRLRGYKYVPADVKQLFPRAPEFAKDKIANHIGSLRHAIQHLDERLIDVLHEGNPFALAMSGPETAIPDASQPDQTLKRIDRLSIGEEEVLLSDLVSWLREMGDCADTISRYQRPT